MDAQIETAPRARESAGWRAGRPAEDPRKLKRWGFIAAQPSEYLIHVRGGRVRAKTSGQGASCFKLPWDSVAVVPTSLQKLQFTADQVTTERIGVQVTGLAVYRIANPLLAYRVLNFSYPERAQEKLELTLGGMFVGASRRLIANLTVDDCMQKRKRALAEELLREVAPIVGGDGHPDDPSAAGWGVVIDTIEIQEVRVLSGRVFEAMQAPFRAAMDRRAREARAEAEREVATREAECRRVVEEARIRTEMSLREQRLAAELAELVAQREHKTRAADADRASAEASLAARAAVQLRELELARDEAHARARDALDRLALAVAQAEAEGAAHAAQMAGAAARAELSRVECGADAERRRALADLARVEGEADAAAQLARAQAELARAEAQARLLVAEHLPALAAAVGQRFGEVNVTQIGGGTTEPFAAVTQAVAAVLALARDGGKR